MLGEGITNHRFNEQQSFIYHNDKRACMYDILILTSTKVHWDL